MRNLRAVTCAFGARCSLVSSVVLGVLSGCGQGADPLSQDSVVADTQPAEFGLESLDDRLSRDRDRRPPADRDRDRRPPLDPMDWNRPDQTLYRCTSDDEGNRYSPVRHQIDLRVRRVRSGGRGGWDSRGELYQVDIEIERGRRDLDLQKLAVSRQSYRGIDFMFVDVGPGGMFRRTGESLRIQFDSHRRRFADGDLILKTRQGVRRFDLACSAVGGRRPGGFN